MFAIKAGQSKVKAAEDVWLMRKCAVPSDGLPPLAGLVTGEVCWMLGRCFRSFCYSLPLKSIFRRSKKIKFTIVSAQNPPYVLRPIVKDLTIEAD